MDGLSSQGVEDLVDRSPMGGLQKCIILVCAAVAMIDGFDTQIIGLVAPDIAQVWHVSPPAFGLVFGLGLFGGMIGGLLSGSACDRFGRKPTLLVATAIFAVLSLATPLVSGIGQLQWLRFFTGLGLGGVFPCIIAMTTEIAPRRLRTQMVGWMFCGFPFGAVIASVSASAVLPLWGWRSMFIVGGVFPALSIPLLWLWLPESIRFLAVRRDKAAFARTYVRLGLGKSWNGRFDPVPVEPAVSVLRLVSAGRAVGTMAIWTTLFLSLLMAYFLLNWLPLIARQTGIGPAGSVFAVGALNLGTIAGAMGLGSIASKKPGPVIFAAYVLGGVAIALIGQSGHSLAMLLTTCFVAGALATGGQFCMIALGAAFYETAMRATGVGWSIAVGRVGGVVGPVLGGLLIAQGVGSSLLFILTGAVCACAGIAALVTGQLTKHSRPELSAN